MTEPTLTGKDWHLFMALVAVKGNLTREEQDAISETLGKMGVSMTWNAVR